MNQIVPSRLDEYRTLVMPPERARDFYASLPGHIKPAVFERNWVNALMANPALMNYDPRLIFREVSKAAGLGLLLDPFLGEAYIIEAYNYKSKKTEPQLRVGYKGMCKLARQSGNVSGIYAHEVHDRDDVECDLGFPKIFHHRPKLFSDRGDVVGYVATVTFKDGTFDFEPMSIEQCQGIRDRSDAWKAYKANKIKSTPWSTDEVEMSKKTALRRLMKRQEQSPELAEAIRIEDEAEHPEIRVVSDTPRMRIPDPPEPDAIEGPAECGGSEPDQPSSEISGDPVDDMPNEPDAAGEVPEPHCIVGEHYTAKTWSEAYIAAVQTATDGVTVYKWIDANAAQLGKLSRADFARVEKAVKAHQEVLTKSDPISSGIPPKTAKGEMPNIDNDYTGYIEWCIKSIAKANAGDAMDALFEVIDANWGELFPGDKEAILAMRKAREEEQAP